MRVQFIEFIMAAKKSFVLRIDPEISNALERWAADEFRSMNGQIEYLLSQALKKAGRLAVKKNNSTIQKDGEVVPE